MLLEEVEHLIGGLLVPAGSAHAELEVDPRIEHELVRVIGSRHHKGVDVHVRVGREDLRDRIGADGVHGRLAVREGRACGVVVKGHRTVLGIGTELEQLLRRLTVVVGERGPPLVDLLVEIGRRQLDGQRVPRRRTGPGILEAKVDGENPLPPNAFAELAELRPGSG